MHDRRAQLLDAAIDVMSENGISGATTRAITERAGVLHGVFHYCFDSKAALLHALLTRESERALSTAWRLDPDSDGMTEAHAAGRNWAAVILAAVDGLIDGWLTTRDDDTTDAAASLFASSVGAAAAHSMRAGDR